MKRKCKMTGTQRRRLQRVNGWSASASLALVSEGCGTGVPPVCLAFVCICFVYFVPFVVPLFLK